MEDLYQSITTACVLVKKELASEIMGGSAFDCYMFEFSNIRLFYGNILFLSHNYCNKDIHLLKFRGNLYTEQIVSYNMMRIWLYSKINESNEY